MADKDEFPLSHEQLTVISPHKLRDWWMRLRVPLPTRDPARAWAAVRLAYERHDALRLHLVDTADGRVRQRVRPSDQCREAAADSEPPILTARDADVPSAPDPYHQVSRCALLLGAEGVEADLQVHHLGWDDRSAAVFARELLVAVSGAGGGSVAPVASFRDHVRAQYRAGRRMGAAQRAFWDRVCEDAAEVRVPRGSVASSAVVHSTTPVALQASTVLAAAARAARVTPAAMVVAALLRSLAEATGVPDRLVYLVHHGRDDPRFFPVVGFFSRSVPLRVDTGAQRDLSALARSTMLLAAEAVEYSRPPFALYRLARELGLSAAAGGALAEVTINVQVDPLRGVASSAHPFQQRGPSDSGTAMADRVPSRPGRLWFVADLAGAGRLWAEYDPARYPDDQVAAVLSRTAALLARAAGCG